MNDEINGYSIYLTEMTSFTKVPFLIENNFFLKKI